MKNACMNLLMGTHSRFPGRSLLQACVALLLASLLPSGYGQVTNNYHPDAIPRAQITREVKNGQAHPPALSEYYLAIYSGSTTGVYFEVASRVCEMMRKTYSEHHIRCVPLRSNGTSDNVRLMQEGRAQVAIVQSDINWNAAYGLIDLPNARSIMSLHNEMGLLVVRSDAHIRSVADLRGKRVNLAPESSANHRLWTGLLGAHGMDKTALRKTFSAVQDFNKNGICLDYIDAFGVWIGHPAKFITETLASCNARVIGMSDPATEKMLATSHYLFKQTLPANVYPGQTEPIESYGLKATLIAAKQANPYVLYWLTRIVHENTATLRGMHPALSNLDSDELRSQGNFLPFHDGAACYWHPDSKACAWQAYYPTLREDRTK